MGAGFGLTGAEQCGGKEQFRPHSEVPSFYAQSILYDVCLSIL
jgi:hypothetical protein